MQVSTLLAISQIALKNDPECVMDYSNQSFEIIGKFGGMSQEDQSTLRDQHYVNNITPGLIEVEVK